MSRRPQRRDYHALRYTGSAVGIAGYRAVGTGELPVTIERAGTYVSRPVGVEHASELTSPRTRRGCDWPRKPRSTSDPSAVIGL